MSGCCSRSCGRRRTWCVPRRWPVSMLDRRTVVVDEQQLLDGGEYADNLVRLSLAGTRVMRLRDHHERVNRSVPLATLDEAWFVFDRPLRARHLHGAFRRVVDSAAAVTGCLLLALVLPFVWLLV